MLFETERMERALNLEMDFYGQGILRAAGPFLETQPKTQKTSLAQTLCYHSSIETDYSRVVLLLTFDRDHETLPEVINLLSSALSNLYQTLPTPPQGPKSAIFDPNTQWVKRDYVLELNHGVLGPGFSRSDEINLTLWIGVRLQESGGHA